MQLIIDLEPTLTPEQQSNLIEFLEHHTYVRGISLRTEQTEQTEQTDQSKPEDKTDQSKPEDKTSYPIEDNSLPLRQEWLDHNLTQETLAQVLEKIPPTIRINSSLKEGNLKEAFQQVSSTGEIYGYLSNIKPLEGDKKGYKLRIKGVKDNFSIKRFISWCGAFGLTSRTIFQEEKGFFYTDMSHIQYEVIKETQSFLDVEVWYNPKSTPKKGRLKLKSSNNTNEDSKYGSPTPDQEKISTTLRANDSRITSSIQDRLRPTSGSSRVR